MAPDQKSSIEAACEPLSGDECDAKQALDSFFCLSQDLLCLIGLDGSFRRLNPAFERILGYSPQELLGKSWFEIVHSDDRAATQDAVQRLTEGGQATSFETRCLCRDGSQKRVLWNLSSDIAPQCIYAAGHDVTRRQEAEEATRRADTFLTSIVENIPHMIFV